MQIDRGQVIQLLQDRGDPGQADHAMAHLPDPFDLDDQSHLDELARYGTGEDLRPGPAGPGKEGGLGGPPPGDADPEP